MMFELKLFFAGTILFISLIAGLLPLIKHEHHLFFKKLDALVSGVFLGTAFFHLLPDSTKLMQPDSAQYLFVLPYLLCAIAFFLLWGLGRVQLPWIIFIILSVHSLIGGLTLGLLDINSMLWILFIAIIAHKAFDSFALLSVLHKNKVRLVATFWFVLSFAFMTPIGIFAGTASYHTLMNPHMSFITGCFNALAAGSFIYIGFSEGILHHWLVTRTRIQPIELSLLLLGFGVMALLGIWI